MSAGASTMNDALYMSPSTAMRFASAPCGCGFC
eukprot:CAMPEP_0195113766 /NCGR_PEP_ID=MMETSP0448-20130528/103743_1 /TAXON_ID=66468 /ORGANISM="Heterocapsa triquestra, Strain CCMP 448" /LENGTH=32 /DNA_ID= /DNA_START= /DNA_END= /DNA_ORIENTATION=